jgi:hypothetical protein
VPPGSNVNGRHEASKRKDAGAAGKVARTPC